MLIVDFSKMSSEHKEYVPQFLDMLISTIHDEVMDHLNVTYLESKSSHLITADWIRWYRKPKNLKMLRLANLILSETQWYQVDKSIYKIQINPRSRMPGSSNLLEQVARWIEFGDQNASRPILFISHAEAVVRPKINKYWDAFIQAKEGVVKIHECIHVR